jgi:hypothetical protein
MRYEVGMSKKDHKKTNAMRILDTHKVAYNVLEYEWEEGRGTGVYAAEELHLPAERVFKTLVGRGAKTGPVVFCIPVAAELDLKQAARISGNKSVELIHVKELLGITGSFTENPIHNYRLRSLLHIIKQLLPHRFRQCYQRSFTCRIRCQLLTYMTLFSNITGNTQ